MGSTNSQFTLQNCLGIAALSRLQLRSPSAGRTSPNAASSRRQLATTATSAPCPCALQSGLWALRGCFPGLRPFREGGRLLPHPLPPPAPRLTATQEGTGGPRGDLAAGRPAQPRFPPHSPPPSPPTSTSAPRRGAAAGAPPRAQRSSSRPPARPGPSRNMAPRGPGRRRERGAEGTSPRRCAVRRKGWEGGGGGVTPLRSVQLLPLSGGL